MDWTTLSLSMEAAGSTCQSRWPDGYKSNPYIN